MSKVIEEYKVVHEDDVVQRSTEGFELYGPPIAQPGGNFYQAVIKYKEDIEIDQLNLPVPPAMRIKPY